VFKWRKHFSRPVARDVCLDVVCRVNGDYFRWMSNSLVPTQEDVDLVAAFVETARELRAEPFFDPYESPSYSMQSDKLIVMYLGDRFHFRSALIPFRRIWRKGEDTYFADILTVLERYSPDAPDFANWIRSQHENLERQPAHPVRVPIPRNQLIDGWLYSVFVHTNLNRKIKNPHRDFNRKTFEEYLSRCGHAWLEYAFRESVRRAGWLYLQMLDSLAIPQMEKWEADGLKPSFLLVSAFGSSPRERGLDGTLVVRKSSSFYGVDETLIQRFFRLLKRFRLLEETFSQLKMEPEQLLKAFVSSRTVKQIIEDAGWELRLAEHYQPPDEDASVHQYFDPRAGGMGSMWFQKDQLAIVTRDTIRVWSKEFSALKAQL
jgi:hypothetical protein